MSVPAASEDDALDILTYEDVIKEKETKESKAEQFIRRPRRYLQRAMETAIGFPGDVSEFISAISQSSNVPQGVLTNPIEKLIGKHPIDKALELLPRSEEIRAFSAERAPELEPRSQFEKAEDEFVEDVTALALPIKGKIPFMRSIGIALAGNLGKEGMKSLGFSEGAQDMTKMGIMLFSGMFDKGRSIKSFANKHYREALKTIPEGATTPYSLDGLKTFARDLKKGVSTPSKEKALGLIDEITGKVKNGELLVEDAIEFHHNLNELISKAGKDKRLVGNLKQIMKNNGKNLDAYAKTSPLWGDNWKTANQALQGIHTSTKVRNYIRSNVNLKDYAHAAAFLGVGSLLAKEHLPIKKGVATGALAGGTAYAGLVASRLAKNPALRRYYMNVVKASINENKTSLIRNLTGLERVAKKELEQNPFPLVDFDEEQPYSHG